MARYLLDSNAFIWAKTAPSSLAQEAYEIIAEPKNTLYVSIVSLWELADKAAKGKLPEFDPIMRQTPGALLASLNQSGMQLMQVEIVHVETAYRLPLLHRDPFDRLIIGQALAENVTVISRDRAFGAYPGVKWIRA